MAGVRRTVSDFFNDSQTQRNELH